MTKKTISVLYALLILLFFHLSPTAGFSQIVWRDLASAQSLNKDTPKPIFIEFTAKWCGWCKKMEKTTFIDSNVVDMLNEQFYAVKIDFDSDQAIDYLGNQYTGKQLAKEFGIEGLPTMIYLPANLDGSKKIVGYKTSKQLIKVLRQMDNS
ncbi:MAG: thioredoxin fold domain-containing protein [Reichenbachiella sp.]|uniref:thioredoxin family protein n=1 Tax=Reichenbachiella sp. TaxID=2184521 RepID=UPI0032660F43